MSDYEQDVKMIEKELKDSNDAATAAVTADATSDVDVSVANDASIEEYRIAAKESTSDNIFTVTGYTTYEEVTVPENMHLESTATDATAINFCPTSISAATVSVI